mmetsp:Transcript_115734/g.216646  ORF Transcript_115734/g.216646 Transcript_115734/m.216646 type:complete len:86 (-) Transcript_115734:1168-1425(-)
MSVIAPAKVKANVKEQKAQNQVKHDGVGLGYFAFDDFAYQTDARFTNNAWTMQKPQIVMKIVCLESSKVWIVPLYDAAPSTKVPA